MCENAKQCSYTFVFVCFLMERGSIIHAQLTSSPQFFLVTSFLTCAHHKRTLFTVNSCLAADNNDVWVCGDTKVHALKAVI